MFTVSGSDVLSVPDPVFVLDCDLSGSTSAPSTDPDETGHVTVDVTTDPCKNGPSRRTHWPQMCGTRPCLMCGPDYRFNFRYFNTDPDVIVSPALSSGLNQLLQINES